MIPQKRKSASITYHVFYNHPEDTVAIRSNDNILFKTNRGRLVRASTFFSDMFDVCGSSTFPNNDDHPIDLQFSAKVITAYLDIISVSGSHQLEVDYYLLKQVYELFSFTISTKALNTIRKMLVISAGYKEVNERWDLFDFASDFNDVKLAQITFSLLTPSAVSEVLRGEHRVLTGIDPKDERGNLLMWSKRLRPSWQIALFHALIQSDRAVTTRMSMVRNGRSSRDVACESTKDQIISIQKDWTKMGDRFNPREFE
ncbi:hypothetical protein I204_05307 [Kwoniella mangroviensis CBS 8886]|uniref:uncharacterized protein n=1 Tax=Kwoniella mangroviensis CBS 8507 TaxID=1296122 RepID=UPI00080D1AC0|nr:uncharacterized protein I203_04660 [Kwoniella mangroviensis CBS 8507]OCF66329.1 hypothetical protein I203_04660 [Kwoniella mangroviensis CBS 8507]OCF73466.1 hypothetical protein I204_05307 [Kwoniella mangroviensis CBS 8886]